jgi:hypothetical protein
LQGNLSQFTAEQSKRDHQFLRRPHRSVSWRTDLIWWRRGRPILGVVGAAAGEPARHARPPAGRLRPRQELFHRCRGQQTAAGPGQGTWGRAPLVGVEVCGSAAGTAEQWRAGAEQVRRRRGHEQTSQLLGVRKPREIRHGGFVWSGWHRSSVKQSATLRAIRKRRVGQHLSAGNFIVLFTDQHCELQIRNPFDLITSYLHRFDS